MEAIIGHPNGFPLEINRDGSLKMPSSGTAAISSTSVSTTNQTLKAANTSRRGLIISNMAATAVLFIKYGATAVSATSHTVRIPAYGYWEMPLPIYTGRVDGIWDVTTGGGNALVTELE
jgi:hypothetical protein